MLHPSTTHSTPLDSSTSTSTTPSFTPLFSTCLPSLLPTHRLLLTPYTHNTTHPFPSHRLSPIPSTCPIQSTSSYLPSLVTHHHLHLFLPFFSPPSPPTPPSFTQTMPFPFILSFHTPFPSLLSSPSHHSLPPSCSPFPH